MRQQLVLQPHPSLFLFWSDPDDNRQPVLECYPPTPPRPSRPTAAVAAVAAQLSEGFPSKEMFVWPIDMSGKRMAPDRRMRGQQEQGKKGFDSPETIIQLLLFLRDENFYERVHWCVKDWVQSRLRCLENWDLTLQKVPDFRSISISISTSFHFLG
jgi:hypothetical protein